MSGSMLLTALVVLAGVLAGVGVGFLAWGRDRKSGDAIRDAVSGIADLIVARMGEGLEAKHRSLSDDLTRTMEARTDRIEKTVRELKEANQAQLLKQERELRDLTDAKLKEVAAAIGKLQADTSKTIGDLREGLTARLAGSLKESSEKTAISLQESMKLATDTLNQRFDELRKLTDGKLTEISGKVTERLDEGFKKTQATFTDVVKRLTIIDEAQKKIADLSKEMVSLQDILSDKKSRGAFGEVQLNQLVRNALPESAFALQYDLGNGTRADCVLFLPDPTGTVAVDAKFPLENYRRMFDPAMTEPERIAAGRQFKIDVKNHIEAISSKYIQPGVTSDGAVMFLPAEAVFSEIHAHHPDLVELAQKKRVWITSPTTMMAILTTARAVIKDEKTREQVHIIQEHLAALSKDFDRFGDRMDKLAVHIRQAHKDVDLVHTSARKITSRFEKIEQVQLEDGSEPPKQLEAGASE
ncbi:MAG: DNA recombination protein RmuC [Leptospirillia bacterium]